MINTPAPTSKTDLEPDPTLIVSVSLIAAALTPAAAEAETISDTFFMPYILRGETLCTFGGEYDEVSVTAAGFWVYFAICDDFLVSCFYAFKLLFIKFAV